MKTIKTLLILAVMLFISHSTFAHALWIEVNPTAQKGQRQEIKIFYGEFATAELEPLDKWYSDVRDFSLWLVGPDQKAEQITVTAKDNHYVAEFTPKTDGYYYLTVVHEAAEIAASTKYEFSSAAAVKVGKNVSAKPDLIKNSLKVINPDANLKTGADTKVQVLLNGKPYANGKVTVASENGWSKIYTANEAGEITLLPIWKGKYVLEATNFTAGKGEFKGKPFENTWQGATTIMFVQ